jgi:hypothetical protein
MGFEMQLYLKEMRREASEEQEAQEPSTTVLDTIMTLEGRLRVLLRQMDQ